MRRVLAIAWLGFQAGSLFAEESPSPPPEPKEEEPASAPAAAPEPAAEAAPVPAAAPNPELAAPSAPAPEAASKAEESAAATPAKFSYGASASYIGPFSKTSDPLASIGLSLSMPLTERRSLTVNQGFTKFFYLEGEQSEYEPQDTVIGLTHRLTDGTGSFKASTSFDFTTPTSKYSQAQRVHTKPRLGCQLSDSLWDGSLSWRLSLFYRYFVNEFKTTRFETGQGGDPFPWMHYGGGLGFTKTINPDWDISLSFAYSEIQYEQDTGLEDVIDVDALPDHPYSIDLSASYALTSSLNASFGYSNGSQLEAFGGRDFVIFDDALAVWYVSLSYSR